MRIGHNVLWVHRVGSGIGVHFTPMDNQIPKIMQGAEPFFYPGGRVGCLCLHGITASPAEVRWLGGDLATHGLTVYGPRLAGHGAEYRHLARLRWQDWYLSALDGYHMLRQQCDQIFVAGLSMGALLALTMASSQPVDGLVVMAAPLKLPSARSLAMARWIKLWRRYMYMPDTSDFPTRLTAEQERRREPVLGRVRYDWWATQALEELHALMTVTDQRLHQVTAPTLLIYSESDETVPLINQQYIHERLGSDTVECVTYQRSGHILAQDYDYQDVIERAAAFINKHTTSTAGE
jgi:carboxylesterase